MQIIQVWKQYVVTIRGSFFLKRWETMHEIFVPARITHLLTIESQEIRAVELTVPEVYEINGVSYSVRDAMWPGTAFLARPMGYRTRKLRRRMYTRSNCSMTAPYVLQTIINHTHEEKADTSIWWQTSEVEDWMRKGIPLDVRLEWDDAHTGLHIYENTKICKPSNLRLEPDGEWEHMRIVAIGFSTGLTPFLSYVRYMAAHDFGKSTGEGVRFTLIVSVRHPGQLMFHEELLEVERLFPQHFRYHPVLTRVWPDDWKYSTGRLFRVGATASGEPVVDLGPLRQVVPDLQGVHLRFCGNKEACHQLEMGLRQAGITPLSFRSEVW
ncbi:MAG: hypothetical protein D6690_10350 [Nitrospirae bacterium]|nr:MAG: hypothetical protein D6690_10350 [Nitrospirota bacterium]